MKTPRIENMESPRSGRPVPNQFIIYTEEGEYFQSYSTIIAFRHRGSDPCWVLDKDKWNCSVTTSKYRNQFTGMTTKETEKAIKDGRIKLEDLNS